MLEELKKLAEEKFQEEFYKALAHIKKREPLLHPSKQSEVARRVARKMVNRWLQEEYGLTMEDIEAKLMAKEFDVSLEDLAV